MLSGCGFVLFCFVVFVFVLFLFVCLFVCLFVFNNAAVLAPEGSKSSRSDFFVTEICDVQRPTNQNNYRLHMI